MQINNIVVKFENYKNEKKKIKISFSIEDLIEKIVLKTKDYVNKTFFYEGKFKEGYTKKNFEYHRKTICRLGNTEYKFVITNFAQPKHKCSIREQSEYLNIIILKDKYRLKIKEQNSFVLKYQELIEFFYWLEEREISINQICAYLYKASNNILIHKRPARRFKVYVETKNGERKIEYFSQKPKAKIFIEKALQDEDNYFFVGEIEEIKNI